MTEIPQVGDTIRSDDGWEAEVVGIEEKGNGVILVEMRHRELGKRWKTIYKKDWNKEGIYVIKSKKRLITEFYNLVNNENTRRDHSGHRAAKGR
jgi:hypothetical protein